MTPSALTHAADYAVDVSDAIEPFLARWSAMQSVGASPFQSPTWLRAWYATLGSEPGCKPVLVGVRRADAPGRDVMLLALSSRRHAGVSVVEFADAGVVDYNLPRLAADWAGDNPSEGDAARRLWRALRGALSAHDVLRIDKMLGAALAEAVPVRNPLRLALRTRPCAMFGNQFRPGAEWDAWRYSLDKRVRKELERSWRVFTRSAAAGYVRVTDGRQARRVLESLERLQTLRIEGLGYPYRLDEPAYRALYRRALEGGLADGSVVLTALIDGDDVVAALFGVANAHRFIALRLATAGEAWKQCSPGRLLLERTAHDLHASGFEWFDFGIGDYAYKEVFKVSRIELFDACVALSWRGLPMAWGAALRAALKRQAWLVQIVRGRRARSQTG